MNEWGCWRRGLRDKRTVCFYFICTGVEVGVSGFADLHRMYCCCWYLLTSFWVCWLEDVIGMYSIELASRLTYIYVVRE
jgi:hypothetical protein